jgi:hypothetical protein
MARPNVTLTVVDDSIVIPTAEPPSPTIGLMISHAIGATSFGGGLGIFGTTAEKALGYYLVETPGDWVGRLQTFTQTEYNLGGASGLTFIAGNLKNNGVTFWTNEWYAVNNYLQYGSPCYVGFTSTTNTSGYESLNIDVAFAGVTAGNTKLIGYLNTKQDKDSPVFGVLAVTEPMITTIASTITWSGAGVTLVGVNADTSPFVMAVYGEKNQLNLSGDADTFVKTILTPDVAGCFARTDRVSFPWISPAGTKRGQILNVVSLTKSLTDTEQDYLYDNDINPIVTFPGEGTILFGDKTYLVDNASTLDAVNVARLVIYLRRVLGQLGRTILFEQNDSISRNRFLTSADAILRNIKAQSGVTDYKIVCDESNNPPSVVQARQFVADILIKAIPSINFIKITITNKSLTATL